MARLARPTAHELRGALSSVQIHLELLSAAMDADDATGRARRDRCLRVLREECRRIQRLSDAFLALAVLPSGAGEVDLGAMAMGVVAAAQPFGSERRLRLEAAPPPTLVRRVAEPEACRQRLLEALLGTLADAAPGSTVQVELAADGRYADIRVAGGAATQVELVVPEGPGDA